MDVFLLFLLVRNIQLLCYAYLKYFLSSSLSLITFQAGEEEGTEEILGSGRTMEAMINDFEKASKKENGCFY